MPSLSNQKHERFAQAMSLEGAEQRKAYLSAGFQCNSEQAANVNASKLMRRPEVKARIAELRTDRVENLVSTTVATFGPLDKEFVTRAARARKMARIAQKLEVVMDARAIEYRYLPGGGTGIVVLKKTEKDGTKIHAVDTKTIAQYQSLCEQIARELGQWVEKRDDTLEVRHISDLSDEMLDELIKEAAEIQEREDKLKIPQAPAKGIELHRVDPGDEEPTGAGEPVVTYAPSE